MKTDTPKLGEAIEVNEARIKDYLGDLVRGPFVLQPGPMPLIHRAVPLKSVVPEIGTLRFVGIGGR